MQLIFLIRYSVPKLIELYINEIKTGKLDLPDY